MLIHICHCGAGLDWFCLTDSRDMYCNVFAHAYVFGKRGAFIASPRSTVLQMANHSIVALVELLFFFVLPLS